MTDAIDKARQALQKALARLPPEQEVANHTLEQLHFLIAEAVSLEIDSREKEARKRRTERWDRFWKWIQRAGYIIGPLAGLAVLSRACGWI